MEGEARRRILSSHIGVFIIKINAVWFRFYLRERTVYGPSLCAFVGNVTQQVGVMIRGLGGGVVSYVNGKRIFDGCFVRSLILALLK